MSVATSRAHTMSSTDIVVNETRWPNGLLKRQWHMKGGVMHGLEMTKDDSGDLCGICEWKDGKKDGVSVNFFQNRPLNTESWKDNVRHGNNVHYHHNGEVDFVSVYENDQFVKCYDDFTQLRHETEWSKWGIDGTDEQYHCVSCRQRIRSMLYPCGHLALCFSCSSVKDKGPPCPMCRCPRPSIIDSRCIVKIPKPQSTACMDCGQRPRSVVLNHHRDCNHLTVCPQCVHGSNRCPECSMLRWGSSINVCLS